MINNVEISSLSGAGGPKVGGLDIDIGVGPGSKQVMIQSCVRLETSVRIEAI